MLMLTLVVLVARKAVTSGEMEVTRLLLAETPRLLLPSRVND